ncbi:MAG: carboxymuconolactone decarboxylase family protein [Endomicrobiales bacterium]
MKQFKKRNYSGLSDVLRDAGFFFMNAWPLLKLASGRGLSPAFRERLMLSVTGVNKCRYCSFVHAKAALSAGAKAPCCWLATRRPRFSSPRLAS